MAASYFDIPQLQQDVAYERNEASYKQIFLHFYTDLYRFAFSMVKCSELADEIVSDVMMKIWNLEEELATIANLKLYLFAATKNTAINYILKNNKTQSWDIDSVDVTLYATEENPENIYLGNEVQAKVQEVIRGLPPKCQLVYKLIKEDGFSYKEVAEIMNISLNTVDSHLFKAVKKITAALKFYLH